ncbi:MAG: histone deacetylase family protein [Anaerolineae bacterium]
MTVGYIYNPVFLDHVMGDCPEGPQRLDAIMQRLQVSGLLSQLERLPSRPATLEELQRNHAPELISLIKGLAEGGGGDLDNDTFISKGSYQAALYAVGAAITASELACTGQVARSIVLERPPGHHATTRRAMGFCLFNNVAVAAHAALALGWVKRLAIVDFDVHHGNGTASSFAEDPRVLFISTHQSPLFPGTGDWRDIGFGEGRGSTLNIPLAPYTGDLGFRLAYDLLIAPALQRFHPELILVSAGYDAHWSDPLADLMLSVSAFWEITHKLITLAEELCSGRLVYILEGGYNLEALGHCVAASIAAMLEQPYKDPLGASSLPEDPLGFHLERIARLHGLYDPSRRTKEDNLAGNADDYTLEWWP